MIAIARPLDFCDESELQTRYLTGLVASRDATSVARTYAWQRRVWVLYGDQDSGMSARDDQACWRESERGISVTCSKERHGRRQ